MARGSVAVSGDHHEISVVKVEVRVERGEVNVSTARAAAVAVVGKPTVAGVVVDALARVGEAGPDVEHAGCQSMSGTVDSAEDGMAQHHLVDSGGEILDVIERARQRGVEEEPVM